MDCYLGMIFPWACNFAPMSFAYCNGAMINVAQNQALYSLLGNTYGGSVNSTFCLPDLRGRVPMGSTAMAGSQIVTQPYILGQKGGNETVQLSTNNLPAHTHQVVSNVTVAGSASANVNGNVSIPVSSNASQANSIDTNSNWYLGRSSDSAGNSDPCIYNQEATKPASTLAPIVVNSTGVVTMPQISVTSQAAMTGSNVPVSIVQPYIAINYIICTQGLYPQRD